LAEPANILSWNPANWITVILMVALAYLILGAGVKIARGRAQSKGNGNVTQMPSPMKAAA
jgi:hypothetical protein